MRKQKILLVIATLCLLVLAFSFSVSAQDNNPWVSNPDGTWSYYENGEMVCGQWRLDSKGWVFLDWDGIMVTNGFVEDSQGTCYVDETGHCVTDKWIEAKRYEWDAIAWYYFDANGHMVTEDWVQASGGWCYMDYNGRMVTDQLIWEFNESLQRSLCYYINADGYMVTNTWYQNDMGYWYYFSADGTAYYNKIALIDGKYYAFDFNFYMFTEGEHDFYDGIKQTLVSIKVTADGSLVTNTWVQIYDEHIDEYFWHYYGPTGAKYYNESALIDGVWYGFSGYEMADGIEFGTSKWNSVTEEWEYTHYRAKKGGELYVNTWYKTEYGSWYYYGEGGKAAQGLVQMGDAYYYFDDNGYAYSNQVIEGIDGAAYYFDDNCYGYKISGWFLHPDRVNSWYYAFADGTLAREGAHEINGTLYVFDYDGRMLSDTIYEDWLVSKDGYVITNEGWNAHDGSWVYIKDGCVCYGWLQLGNTWYYFDPYMSYCAIISDGNLLYATAVNGTYAPITAEGFYTHSDGYTVYVTNGTIVLNNWAQIGGDWYYFNDYGAMITNSTYEINGVRYYFDLNGKMASGGWVSPRPDTWMWAAADGALFTGLDNSGYVFSEYGYLLDDGVYAVNDRVFVVDADGKKVAELYNIGWNQVGSDWYYVSDEYDEIRPYRDQNLFDNGKRYHFGPDGKMICNERFADRYYGADGAAVSGWLQIDGDWYYADEYYCDFVTGFYYINDIEYYFRDYILQTNTTIMAGDEIITTNGDGLIVSRTDANGWIYNNYKGRGNVYYYENGEAFNGWKGDYYIDYGLMAQDQVVYDPKNEKNYYVGINGLCVYDQWIERKGYYGYGGYASTYDYAVDISSTWMLARPDGSLLCDEWYSNGINWYYFDYTYMVSDCIITIDGERHEFDENGIWLGQVGNATSNNPDGWVKENGKWYFYMAGEPVNDKEIYDNGNWYRLNYNGEMVTDEFYYSIRIDGYYYYDANGIRLEATGWQKINGKWTYFTKEHLAITGWINDGGVKYYQSWNYSEDIDDSYITIYTGVHNIGDKLCYFDSEGVYQYDITGHGWYQVDDIWYYLDDGELVRDESEYYINGAYYAFDYDGWMYTDAIVDGRYYSESGQMVTASGWYIVNHKYIYINSEGYVCRGVHVIDGKEYCFDGYYI